jgi:NADPH:quinone reductase-like Zn-dependent oxidoreductase
MSGNKQSNDASTGVTAGDTFEPNAHDASRRGPSVASAEQSEGAAMETMKALRAHQRGGPEVLVFEDAPKPEPGPREVRVAPSAAAITFAELTWDETWSHIPTTPSHEFSGVVDRVGEEVTTVTAGQEVYGFVPFDRNGAAATFVVVPEEAVAPRPQSVSHVEAAAVPVAALTAWQALMIHARLGAGDRVLIHGGAGGVGAYAVQMAAGKGADVTATAFAADVGHATRLGATTVIDVSSERFDEESGVFDIVIDTVGGETLDRSFAVLRPGGRLVTLQAPPSQERAAELGVEAIFFVVSPSREELVAIADLVDRGELEITIAATYPVEAGREAFESGQVRGRPPGKTVLTIP